MRGCRISSLSRSFSPPVDCRGYYTRRDHPRDRMADLLVTAAAEQAAEERGGGMRFGHRALHLLREVASGRHVAPDDVEGVHAHGSALSALASALRAAA